MESTQTKGSKMSERSASKLVNTPDKPLSCGAVIYIETRSAVSYRTEAPA